MASESSLTRRQVLKVYLTEAAARADTNPLKVQNDTALILNGEQDANYNFFTHEKYWFRIEANEPVKEFYIDWDDGEDNDPKGNANYTSIKFDTPQFVGITSHIFTRAKFHYPKIRVKSVDGFWSKYYQAHGDNNFYGIDILQGDAALGKDGTTGTGGRNNKYVIESDETGTDADNRRIPIYAPTVKPPVGVLKTDKKRVFAGIDNSVLLGPDAARDGETLTLIGTWYTTDGSTSPTATSVQVRVTYTTTGAVESDTTDGVVHTNRGDVTVTDLTLATTPPTITNVTNVLKMELLNNLDGGSTRTTTKILPSDKIILYSGDQSNVVGEVSLGNPIVEANDPRSTVTLDATESFCRTPEQSITSYTIHDGNYLSLGTTATTVRGFTADGFQKYKSKSTSQVSDVLEAGNKNAFSSTTGVRKASYTFRINYEGRDEDARWLPAEVMAECQVIADDPHDLDGTDAKATYTHSFVEHWRNEAGDTEPSFYSTNYSEDRAAVAGYTWPSDMQSSRLLAFHTSWPDTHGWNDLGNFFTTNTSGAEYQRGPNGTGYYPTLDFTRNSSGGMSYRYLVNGGATLGDSDENSNYLIIASDEPFSGVWFESHHNHSNKAPIVIPSSGAAGGKVAVRPMLFYSAPEASGANQWKPLRFRNTTKHPDYNDSTFYTRGSWSWQQPQDWASVDPGTIPDHYWPQGDFEGTAEAFSSHNRFYAADGQIDSDGDLDSALHTPINTLSNVSVNIGGFLIGTDHSLRIEVTGDPGGTETMILFTAAGTKVTLTATAGGGAATTSSNTNSPTFAVVPGNNASTAENIRTALNAHTGFTATRADMVVTVTRVLTITGTATESTQFFDIDNLWDGTNKKYAIMAIIDVDTDNSAYNTASGYNKLQVSRASIIDGQQSQLITVEDPMHVSLNSRAITQSITYAHKGKHQIVEDRLGIADIRKIGASGGTISFGGIDMSVTEDRAKFTRYQNKAVPVYLDVTHEDSSISRFFGIITDMSRDHPTGKVKPKFGLKMRCSHMINLNSSGGITSDGYISLGGGVSNEPRYI